MFIMDTSGSMGASAGNGQTRMDVAKNAARNFVQGAQNINISLMSFNYDNGGKVDFASQDIDTGRAAAVSVINGYSASGLTPLSETLYEAYRYFAGQTTRFGGNSVDAAKSGNTYISPIVNSCQKSNIVLFTDGDPFYDTDAVSDIRTLVSGASLPSGLSTSCSGDGGCLDEMSWYMFNNDISSLASDQNIVTYTIGGFGSAPPGLLTSTANHGGGEYYNASNASQLQSALEDILLRVNAEDSSFAAPTTSTSAFNSLETAEDVYYIVFKPDVGPNWKGNLKRYRLGNDNQVYDQNGNLAIDSSTGFFLETAQSYWSSSVDGKEVTQGGMVEHLTQGRAVYTNTGGASNQQLNLATNNLHESNSLITNLLLGATSSTNRTEILQWARGIDIDDEDSDSSTTDDRKSVGDPLHTQPQVITYFKDSISSVTDKAVFFTTNDGFLHAVDTDDGSAEFSFIPTDLLTNLRTYRNGYVSGGTLKVYGMDGPMTYWVHDPDGDGDLLQSAEGSPDTNNHAYLYLTMRRGGNNIYALDVTNRSSPVLKWMIRGDVDNNATADATGDFRNLGQTWSALQLAEVNYSGTRRQVLFFGGGYDSSTDSETTIQNNNIGNSIYMIDAETGALLWQASATGANLNVAQMDYGIPAGLSLVDINQDGLTDYIFAADVGGQIIRIDINQTNTGSTNFATGGVIARLSGTGAANARRFFEQPDVVLGKDRAYFNITVGSGYRPSPLNTAVTDRMYVIRDPHVYQSPTSYNYISGSVITESNLYDATANLVQQGSSSEKTLAQSALDNSSGWYITLQVNGEKVLSKAKVFGGTLLFNTFAPRQSSTITCGPQAGENYFYAVNIEDASAPYNLDTTNSALNKSDRKQLLQSGTIAPTPSVISRGNQGAEICVGTQCFQNILQSGGSIPINRMFWRENNL
nr:PilC/PilY family type IV pilus protein [Endozoicomonas sp. OPT23]